MIPAACVTRGAERGLLTWSYMTRAGILLALSVAVAACASDPPASSEDCTESCGEADLTGLERAQTLADGESAILVIGTNDIHGSFDRFAAFGGYVDAARAHLTHAYGGDRSTLLLLDAGDATQGTLLSNYSEGQLAIKAMSALGYSAAIAGNHGFDFGPAGWKTDQCPSLTSSASPSPPPPCDPLDALHRSVTAASFPFLGANVKRRADGKPLDFLPPSTIVTHQGRGIAIIGLENHFTDRTTIPENVAALTFSDGKDDLKNEVEALYTSGKADVFVLVMHEGDSDTASMKAFLESLPKRSNGAPLVDVAVAGHSHAINDAVAAGIPYIQSGANGELFGTIEIIAKKDPATGRLTIDPRRTRKKAAIKVADRPSSFLREPITVRQDIASLVRAAADEIEPIAEEKLATITSDLSRTGGRTADSEIGNVIADAMRRRTGADVALINGGDIRDDIPAASGEVLYEDLFKVIPKNLELVTVNELPMTKLVEQVKLSVTSCGRRGALQISGMSLVFDRDCDHAVLGEDRRARLRAILDLNGAPLYERNDAGHETFHRTTIHVATTDFVMSGGSGYNRFAGIPISTTRVLRDEVASDMKQNGLVASTFRRGRYVDCTAHPTDARCSSR